MAHTPLLGRLVAIARLARQTEDKHLDYAQALAAREERRAFLKVAAGAAAVALGGAPVAAFALWNVEADVGVYAG